MITQKSEKFELFYINDHDEQKFYKMYDTFDAAKVMADNMVEKHVMIYKNIITTTAVEMDDSVMVTVNKSPIKTLLITNMTHTIQRELVWMG